MKNSPISKIILVSIFVILVVLAFYLELPKVLFFLSLPWSVPITLIFSVPHGFREKYYIIWLFGAAVINIFILIAFLSYLTYEKDKIRK